MGHDHRSHAHSHPHSHTHDAGAPLPPALDTTIEDGALTLGELGRRQFLRSAGLLGAGAAAVGVLGSAGAGVAAADPGDAGLTTLRGVGTPGWPVIITSTPSSPRTGSTG